MTTSLVRASSSSAAPREATAAACARLDALNGTYTLPSVVITAGSPTA
ncbi:Uncharacterised protein [Mycobacteroides abscessus subsp. abscessus]|nr:Uncharacterised protein [Mycobacteroides abscessus subsp. abscessus]